MIRYCGLIILVLFTTISSFTQITSSGNPLFLPSSDTFFIPEIKIENSDLSLSDKNSVQKLDKQLPSFKNEVFAEPISVNISPEKYGRWIYNTDINKKTWLLKISSPDAISLTIIFDTFKISTGVKVFVYDSLQKSMVGALTACNNLPSGMLPIETILSGSLYIEMQVPLFCTDFGKLTIGTIGVQTVPEKKLKSEMDQWYNRAQWCNNNVACFNSNQINLQKRAVCRIIYLGSQRCTGTLINNIENDGTPYVITAAHCISTELAANSAVFYFNYESPDCKNQDVDTKYSISGASLVAAGYHVPKKYDTLDFALLKLSSTPPTEYQTYYSGWDATGIKPDSTFVIHHPMGDIKKLSYDSQKPVSGNAQLGFDEYTHWLISDYESGTTEVGSSGAGLIDNKGHLIGTLTGGDDPCLDQIDDFYQKLSHSFNDYANVDYQLKHWLDPKNTGKLVCEGFDASDLIRQSAMKLANYHSVSDFKNTKQKLGWGYLAGTNYQRNALFAEKFTTTGSVYLYGAEITPSAVYAADTKGYVRFFVSQGSSLPGEIIYEKDVPISLFDKENAYYIDFDSTLLVSQNFFFGYKIQYNTDTLALMTIPVQEPDNTAFTYIEGSWQKLQLDGKDSPSHLAIMLFAFDYMPNKNSFPDTSNSSNITIYPNPASGQLQILFKEIPKTKLSVTLFDLYGRQLYTEEFIEPGLNMPFLLPHEQGVYIMHIRSDNNKTETFKILVY